MNLFLSFQILCLLLIQIVFAKSYKDDERVILFVNKVGPFYNPHETYHYYKLPVCAPIKIEHKTLSLGEILDGDRMAFSMYDINFKVDVKDKILCSKHLLHKQVEILNHAIEDLYYFEFIIDQIPMHDFIGKLQETAILPHAHKAYLWTHSHFTIGFNGDKIIYANITNKLQDPLYLHPVDSMNVTFTYSVTWIKTSDSYKERPSKVQVLPKTFEIHWLSIINSLALVLILNGFVAIIMVGIQSRVLVKVLKKDFAKYNLEDIEDVDDDENGWKIIHSDVFRYPVQKTLFCAILGVGSQFLAIISGVLTLAVLGFFNVHRHGSINTAAIILYALTSCISGFVSSGMYNKMDGERWVRCINLTSALFIAPFCIVWAAVNSIAWAYGSTQALPWETIFLLACTWAFLGYPLTIVGGVFGKNWSGKFNAPCRTKRIPREIPELPLYRGPLMHCFIGGFLPFSAISVELYYIFSNVWGRESYTLYGVLAIVFMILISLTASISVSLTYFQLNVEDYRWWWRSVYCAGSTGFFVFLYSLFYYFKRSNMSGFLQTTEFFGYTLLCCYVFFLTLGTVGFFASLRFVRYIYVNIKMD